MSYTHIPGYENKVKQNPLNHVRIAEDGRIIFSRGCHTAEEEQKENGK